MNRHDAKLAYRYCTEEIGFTESQMQNMGVVGNYNKKDRIILEALVIQYDHWFAS